MIEETTDAWMCCLFRFTQKGTPMPLKGYPKNPTTIGEHLIKRRMDLNWSKRDVSRYLGIGFNTLYTWESGRHTPYITYLGRIREFLGYSVWHFDTTTLSGRILEYRHRHGLTAEQFGKLVGVSISAVRSWELGEFNPNKEVSIELNEVLENTKRLYHKS